MNKFLTVVSPLALTFCLMNQVAHGMEPEEYWNNRKNPVEVNYSGSKPLFEDLPKIPENKQKETIDVYKNYNFQGIADKLKSSGQNGYVREDIVATALFLKHNSNSPDKEQLASIKPIIHCLTQEEKLDTVTNNFLTGYYLFASYLKGDDPRDPFFDAFGQLVRAIKSPYENVCAMLEYGYHLTFLGICGGKKITCTNLDEAKKFFETAKTSGHPLAKKYQTATEYYAAEKVRRGEQEKIRQAQEAQKKAAEEREISEHHKRYTARLKAEENAQKKAAEEARKEAEEEKARRRIAKEEKARKKAEQKKVKEETARRIEEEARMIAEAKTRKEVEEEPKKAAKAEEEAKRKIVMEAEARKKAEEKARKVVEAKAREIAEEEAMKAEARKIAAGKARKVAQRKARKIAEVERKKAEALKKTEEEHKRFEEEVKRKKDDEEKARRLVEGVFQALKSKEQKSPSAQQRKQHQEADKEVNTGPTIKILKQEEKAPEAVKAEESYASNNGGGYLGYSIYPSEALPVRQGLYTPLGALFDSHVRAFLKVQNQGIIFQKSIPEPQQTLEAKKTIEEPQKTIEKPEEKAVDVQKSEAPKSEAPESKKPQRRWSI